MNKQRRKKLNNAMSLLYQAADIVTDARFEELFAMGNLPENMQFGDKYAAMEEAAEHMDAILDIIYAAISEIEDTVK